MKLLRENPGVIEPGIFITTIARNDFDYTKWRESLWDDLTAGELFRQTANQEYTPPKSVQII